MSDSIFFIVVVDDGNGCVVGIPTVKDIVAPVVDHININGIVLTAVPVVCCNVIQSLKSMFYFPGF